MEVPPLPPNLMLLLEVGSTAHGTGLPGSEDHDEMGIVVEYPHEVLGLTAGYSSRMQRTQPEGSRSGPEDTDRTLHSLRRFLSLAAAGNPSILTCFWAPVIKTTGLGTELRTLAPAFVGRHCVPKYRGYMRQQGERLLGIRGKSGHGRRGAGQRSELVQAHGFDTKYAMHCARLGFQGIELLTTGRLELPIPGESGDWLRSLRRGVVPFQEWWDRCVELDATLESLANNQEIPSGPDTHTIVNWSVDAHQRAWETA